MNFFLKYGIGIYLSITLLYKLYFLIPLSFISSLYYFIMVIGLILVFKRYQRKSIVGYAKSFKYLFSVLLLNLLYLLIFGGNTESILYWFAKLATTNLIVFGIVSNYNFYERVFIKYFKYIILVIILIGYMFGVSDEIINGDVNRLSMGFNPNDLGLFSALGALAIMLINKTWYKSKIDGILFFVFCLLTLLSGSKAALLNLVVGILLIYGISFKLVVFSISLWGVFLLTPKLNYTTSIDRLLSKESAFETRNEVFEIGLLTFDDSFWTGHGIDKYGWTDPKYWSSPEEMLGPHNTYLSIGIMYGVIFGSIFIFLLLIQVIKSLRIFLNKHSSFVKFSALIVILSVINGFFESLIVGVNEFVSVLFWFAVGVVSYSLSTRNIKLNFKKY